MTFTIATSTPEFSQPTRSASAEGSLDIRFTDWTRADREKRKIIETIEGCETPEQVRDYYHSESLLIDALFLFDDTMVAEIKEAANDHAIILGAVHGFVTGSGAPVIAQTLKTEIVTKENTMTFQIDTGASTGSQGPFMSYYSNGSALKGLPPKAWALRSKGDDGNWSEQQIEAFSSDAGCVMDLDSLKLGWERDTQTGPERRWNPSISQATPRPDESTDDTGRKAWKNCLSIRCAIGGGQAATWEQGAFGAYMAFDRLTKLIMAQYPGDGTLPLVKMVGTTMEYKSNVPTFDIVKWVPRPDCLKADAPTIQATPAPQAAPQAAPVAAAPVAPVAGVPDDVSF